MSIEKRLSELGIRLPVTSIPSGSYIPAVEQDGIIFTSGQVPRVDGEVKFKGKVGHNADIEQGYQGARICAINCLAAIDELVGLDNVERIIKVTGFVNATADFEKTFAVIDGASDLLLEVFAEKGIHARSAIGVQALPGGAVCEVEMVVKIVSQ
ncbi:RidA family protein [Raoultella terrigena]|uniref:RidA family protein n=1 Tax=Raoultella terrigena TaxID=577 RepID=UPI001F524902|nr:RidA family protein [Raoultella terrigena]MCI1034824.1 RidA family protein [Raoultella terrigena]